MITLIKIRRKYLSNHYCAVYWSYFFIPSLMLIFLLFNLNSFEIKKYSEKNKFEGKDFNMTKALFSQNITFNKNFSFISNDEKDKKIMQKLIKADIEWFYQSSEEFDEDLWPKINRKNLIIKINNENERYKINLIQNKKNAIFNYSLNIFSYSNPFVPPNNNINNFECYNEFFNYNLYWLNF